jgi:hypothetical protein
MQRQIFFFSLVLNYLFLCALPAQAQLLQGGIERNEMIPKVNLQSMMPKVDTSDFKPKCLCINPDTVQKLSFAGHEKIVDGGLWLLDFGSRADLADQALHTIKHYRFTELCNVDVMQFFLSEGKSPIGPMSGEDAIYFDNSKIKAEKINGNWKITEGDHWMLDFAQDEQAAQDAANIIRYYGFAYECFIGRPHAPMMYFRK